MQLFVLTVHCQSKAHCNVCRSMEKGRQWRKSISNMFEMPKAPDDAKDPLDFICPYGEKWDHEEALNGENMANTDDKKITSNNIDNNSKKPYSISRNVNNARNTGSRSAAPGGGCGCSRSGNKK